MKEFVKIVLAVICGIFIVGIIGFFLLAGAIGSVAALGTAKPVLPREGVLDLNMSEMVIEEQDQSLSVSGVALLSGSMNPSIGIWSAVQAIDAAASDPSVKYILLRPDNGSAGNAQLQELRAALGHFRESGKAVVAYIENPSNASYYLASVADKVYMGACHGGTSSLIGISGQMLYLKDLLDRLGIHVQLIRHGKYKSAGERYIRSTPSPENLEQTQGMINSMWKSLAAGMAESRDLSMEEFNGLVDNLVLNFPEDFKAHGLVDEVFTHSELVQKLCDLAVVGKVEDLHLVRFSDYVTAKVTSLSGQSKNSVAILFANGQIVDEDDYGNVSGKRFVQAIDALRKDRNVQAVVLRVNSPGGSVAASSEIRNALELLKAEKPVVASYGDYAASGGYWISAGANYIFSNPVTLTGSIGVFSMIPEFSKTAKDLVHVHVTTVGSNRHSDMFSLMRPFDKEETDYLQASVEDIYAQFVALVAEGRGMTAEAVDAIAQGRVWTGADALGIGLVDALGTLEDAVKYAASLAELSEFKVVEFPKPLTTVETLMQLFGENREEPYVLSGTPFKALESAVRSLQAHVPTKAYALLPYSIEIK